MVTPKSPAGWDLLMRAALDGDANAYRRLLDELARALRTNIRAMLARSAQGNADVEDLVQETLLAVHLKRHTWDTALPFAPWANAIARYKVIDALRRRGVRTHVALDDVVETLASPPAEDSAMGDAERLILRLDARQQTIVRGVSIDGRSTGDVARELDMSEGAVRVALHRALKRLADLYRSRAHEN